MHIFKKFQRATTENTGEDDDIDPGEKWTLLIV